MSKLTRTIVLRISAYGMSDGFVVCTDMELAAFQIMAKVLHDEVDSE